jgi:hypothetical protein
MSPVPIVLSSLYPLSKISDETKMNRNDSKNIKQAEESIETAFLQLNKFKDNPALAQVLEFLAPRGYRPVVELQEDGRSIRRHEPADSWTPEVGEIRIYFEPANEAELAAASEYEPEPEGQFDDETLTRELHEALEQAENTPGHTFVAIKWFRDTFLPSRGYPWAQRQERRHMLLSRAIEEGTILTSRIANPRAPLHPTTTIRLNRQVRGEDGNPIAGVSRFKPVAIGGGSLIAEMDEED